MIGAYNARRNRGRSGFTPGRIGGIMGACPPPTRPQKITVGEMRDTGLRGNPDLLRGL